MNETVVMQNTADDEITIDILDLARRLLKNLWLIILVTVIGGAIAFALTFFFITPQYESTVYMYVNNSSFDIGSTSVSLSSSDLTASKSLVDTYEVILGTRKVLNEVIARSGVDYTYKEIKDMISADSVNSTEVFQITVTDPDPEEACLIANTIADVLPDVISEIVDGCSARVVDYAVVDTNKVSPSYTKNCLLGGIAGFVLICILIVIIYLLDDTIADETFLNTNYSDIPVLASIPDLESAGKRGYGYGYGVNASNKKKKKDRR